MNYKMDYGLTQDDIDRLVRAYRTGSVCDITANTNYPSLLRNLIDNKLIYSEKIHSLNEFDEEGYNFRLTDLGREFIENYKLLEKF